MHMDLYAILYGCNLMSLSSLWPNRTSSTCKSHTVDVVVPGAALGTSAAYRLCNDKLLWGGDEAHSARETDLGESGCLRDHTATFTLQHDRCDRATAGCRLSRTPAVLVSLIMQQQTQLCHVRRVAWWGSPRSLKRVYVWLAITY